MNKYIIGIVLVIIIAGGAWYFTADKTKIIEITKDTTKTDLFTVENNEKIILKNGAVLTVLGGMIVRGEISGDLDTNIVVKSDVTFEESSILSSGGSIQIVGDINNILKTDEEVDIAFNEAGEDVGAGLRVGPIVPNTSETESGAFLNKKRVTFLDKAIAIISNNTEIAYAEEDKPDIKVNVFGKIDLSGSDSEDKDKRKKIVLFSFPKSVGKVQINFKNLSLISPQNTPRGSDDIRVSCNAKGGDGSNGLRLRAIAWGIDINNVTIQLAKGGDGGNATTDDGCKPGIAIGGSGGESGNMKFTAVGRLVISGVFHIIPGESGNGGEAIAFGKDGEKGEDGGYADAKGGNGGDNNKKLAIQGSVVGTENITVDELLGGNGGDAFARGGSGGDNEGCGNNGGNGGGSVSRGGKGGDASLVVFGVSSPVFDVGGNGGSAESKGSMGGDGGDCDSKGSGGDGGSGGDAVAKKGTSGIGDTNGKEGSKTSTGGDGGKGGDGCLPGYSGVGGVGDIDGKTGADGKNLCNVEKKKKDISVGDDVIPVKSKLSFSHVKPGEYSEVYLDVEGKSGSKVSASLKGPAVDSPNMTGTVGKNGKIRLTWRIYQFGKYTATGKLGSVSVGGSVLVQ